MNHREQASLHGIASWEVHVWYTRSDELTEPDLLAACRRVLSEDERRRQERFVFEKDRHTFLAAHALVRSTLSRYADVAPGDWEFVTNEYGRPEIVEPELSRRLRFNLSHTAGLIACAVTIDHDVGVDVEDVTRISASVRIARRYFSPLEVIALERVAPAAQQRRFFEYWTLKEAYIKARGMGLSLPLDQFSFDFSDPARIRIGFAPELADDPSAWQFAQFEPTERHKMALAVRRGDGGDLKIRIRPTVPDVG